MDVHCEEVLSWTHHRTQVRAKALHTHTWHQSHGVSNCVLPGFDVFLGPALNKRRRTLCVGGGWERGREGVRERGREGGREGEREGGRERGGGSEGERGRGREGIRE